MVVASDLPCLVPSGRRTGIAFGLPCLVPFWSSPGLSPMGSGRRSGTRLRRYPSQIQLYVRPETSFCPSVALSSGPSRSRGHGRPRRPLGPCPFGFLPRGSLPFGFLPFGFLPRAFPRADLSVRTPVRLLVRRARAVSRVPFLHPALPEQRNALLTAGEPQKGSPRTPERSCGVRSGPKRGPRTP